MFNIKTEVGLLSTFGLYPSRPYAYDGSGSNFTSSHISISSISEHYCTFTMSNYIISGAGAIFQATNETGKWEAIRDNQVIFDHPSMCGYAAPKFTPAIVTAASWNDQITRSGAKYNASIPFNYTDVVIALHTPFDDCFNHVSLLALPMIGGVQAFLRKEWDNALFHCGEYTAALLNILGIALDRMLIKTNVFAKRVLISWIPHWQPIESASMKGIYANTSLALTNKLLLMKFDNSTLESLKPLTISSPSHPDMSTEDLMSPADSMRYIVYSSRAGQRVRDVCKESQLLSVIAKHINKSKYRLVVVGGTEAYKGISLMQASWQRFAKIYSKAIVMMGPHGGAFNNMIFTPPDCHVIEFNHFPIEVYHIDETMVRTCFLTAHFAKGGSGKVYNLEPNDANSRTPPDIYFEPFMRISQREVIRILMQINKDIPTHDLLIENINLESIPKLSLADLNWQPPRNITAMRKPPPNVNPRLKDQPGRISRIRERPGH